jgi:ring-1,2-phenylacetyl-CoA epoxidase subunit PaaB
VEFALQNARDVFVRRPDCASLWVVPANAISSLTAEELEHGGLQESTSHEIERETYFVFEKRDHIGSHEYAGSVEATSPEDALQQAVQGDSQVLVWWVVPERSVASTNDDEAPSLFEPARGKLYRTQAFYHTTTLMRKLREKGTR